MAKLSLAVRKDLAAFEKDRNDALAKISALTGNTFTFDDSSLPAVYEKVTMKDGFGQMVNKNYMNFIVLKLTELLSNDGVKAEFNKRITEPKIAFELDDSKKYNFSSVIRPKDGKLVVVTDGASFGYNIGTTMPVWQEDPTALQAAKQLSLPIVKEIADSGKKREEILAEMKTITGIEWTVESDDSALWYAITNNEKYSGFGTGINNYLAGLKGCFQRFCTDAMSKEALGEAASNHKITFEVDPAPGFNAKLAIKNGNVVVIIPAAGFCFNLVYLPQFPLENQL